MASFVKLFGSILDSTIWRESHQTVRVWITLLAMADARGEVSASVPGLADRAKVTLDECLEALERFRSPDQWSRTKEYEGRRIEDIDGGWRILNYLSYRAERDEERRREYRRDWMQEKRAAEKAAPKPKAPKHTAPEQAPEPPGFASFWSAYLKREKRVDALAAYQKALLVTDHDVIMAGLRKWNVAHAKDDRKFIPLPASWLNGQRWLDDTGTGKPRTRYNIETGRDEVIND